MGWGYWSPSGILNFMFLCSGGEGGAREGWVVEEEGREPKEENGWKGSEIREGEKAEGR